ncbi:hypothetical protein CKAH01_05879 [Colletotrichum kahawae]|uniref:Uncharacterized protein n=1 Tax=Colletotrichum kahawae TaxID=34407 RepID=A0AAD9YBI7_COLKA|nr:hypothetical protein CKAH01_05879 [Colletotrichum kahawae]
MKIKLSSSPVPERLGNKDGSIVHIQESTSEMISKIRRGVHAVWGGIGADEERKLREVLQKLVDDIDGLEKTLSRTMKRPRENDTSAIDNKRHKKESSSDESYLHNKNPVAPPHIAAGAHCKIEKFEDDVELLELLSTMPFAPVIDLTADTTSDEESRQASTTHRHDAPLAPEATANEQFGHENDKSDALLMRLLEYNDIDSDQESCNGMTNYQEDCQDESLNAIEMWFRHKVHHGDELLGLLALVDFHESNPDNCKASSGSCRNVRRKVEAAEQAMGCDWEKTVGPLAHAVSAHLEDAGENLEDVLKRFQDHAKAIEPQPDFDDLLLDNAEYIDRIRPSEKHQVYSTSNLSIPGQTSKVHIHIPDPRRSPRINTLPPCFVGLRNSFPAKGSRDGTERLSTV